MRILTAASLCVLLAACGTVEQAPLARPLTQANIDAMGATKVSLTGNEMGVTKAWYFTQVNGGGMGLAGALAGAIVTVIVNAGPSSRARAQADEVAKLETPQVIDGSLLSHLKDEVAKTPASPAPGVTVQDIVLTEKFVTPGELDDAIEVTTTYTLSEDSSVMRVVAVATYKNKDIPYKSPYTFKGGLPASEKTGPLYRNTFTYFSTPLPLPTLTPELKARLVASIQDSARDASGNLPDEKSNDGKSMKHEIDLANDDKLTPNELSVFLTREWLKDDGARIKTEVERAHSFIAKYVLIDINRTAIPALTGFDELVETTPDARTVRRVGHGVESGSYVSSAADVQAPATYGNTVAVGKATVEYVKGRKAAAPKKDKKA